MYILVCILSSQHIAHKRVIQNMFGMQLDCWLTLRRRTIGATHCSLPFLWRRIFVWKWTCSYHNEILVEICYIGHWGNAPDIYPQFWHNMKWQDNNDIFPRFDHIATNSIFSQYLPFNFLFIHPWEITFLCIHHNYWLVCVFATNFSILLLFSCLVVIIMLVASNLLLQSDAPGLILLDANGQCW